MAVTVPALLSTGLPHAPVTRTQNDVLPLMALLTKVAESAAPVGFDVSLFAPWNHW